MARGTAKYNSTKNTIKFKKNTGTAFLGMIFTPSIARYKKEGSISGTSMIYLEIAVYHTAILAATMLLPRGTSGLFGSMTSMPLTISVCRIIQALRKPAALQATKEDIELSKISFGPDIVLVFFSMAFLIASAIDMLATHARA